MTEAVTAARALLPGAAWAPYALSSLPLFGGLAAGFCGERRVWLVGGLWAVAMGGSWGEFNPLGAVQWTLGAAALSAAGWAGVRGDRIRRWIWVLGPLAVVTLSWATTMSPRYALTLGAGGSRALVSHALDRATAGETDEAIVFGDAAVDIATERGTDEEVGEADLVDGSLYAAEGDCDKAVQHARGAHIVLGSDLPKLDEAVRACFAARGP